MSEVFLDVFAAFASIHNCRRTLHSCIMPAVSQVLSDPSADGTLIEGILELSVTLLKECDEELAKSAFQLVFSQLIQRVRACHSLYLSLYFYTYSI